MVKNLLSKNKKAIMGFIKSGSLKFKRRAISIITLTKDIEVLEFLYNIIKEGSDEEYNYLKENIWESFKTYSDDYRIEIKRKIFNISTRKKLNWNRIFVHIPHFT